MGIDQWNNFFLMVGGGAAALAGLVFIAMSINLSIITRDATHKNRAVATMTGFTAVFLICALALMGNQNYRWIGVEWLVVTLVPTITYIRVYVWARKVGRSSVGLSVSRFIAGTSTIPGLRVETWGTGTNSPTVSANVMSGAGSTGETGWRLNRPLRDAASWRCLAILRMTRSKQPLGKRFWPLGSASCGSPMSPA